MEGLSAFDGIGLAILIGSGLMALMRGFVREALSVTAFVAAALAALWARPVFIGLAEEFIPSDLIANIVTLGVIFLMVFLAVSFVTGGLVKNAKEGEDVGVIDRALGFIFGLIRGLVILGLILIIFASATPGSAAPGWIAESRIYPLVNASARLLQALAPEDSRVGQSPVIEAPSGDERPVDNSPRSIEDLIRERANEDDGA